MELQDMGITYASIEIRNPTRPDLRPVSCAALADTGAMHLCIPQHVALQLALDTLEEREVTLADGSKVRVPYVGPLGLRFGNRQCFVGALIMGDEVLLGAIPMEDMDLVVMPMTQQVAVNPANPNIPSSVAKGLSRK
jgi:clan AA aspartic protease